MHRQAPFPEKAWGSSLSGREGTGSFFPASIRAIFDAEFFSGTLLANRRAHSRSYNTIARYHISTTKHHWFFFQEEVRIKMNSPKSFRKLHLIVPFCLLLVVGIVAGCGDDSPTTPTNNNQQTWDEAAGWIGVFADQNGTDCSLQDSGPGTVTYYVVQVGSQGATASEFKIETSGFTGVYVGKTSPFPLIIGDDPMTGISIAYGACLTGPIHILSLTYTIDGSTPPCSWIRVVPHPVSGDIGTVDCNNDLLSARGLTSYINNDGSCPCSAPATVTTWDRVREVMRGQ